jgi:hypothetical protein
MNVEGGDFVARPAAASFAGNHDIGWSGVETWQREEHYIEVEQ